MSEIYKNSTQFVHLDIHGGVADAPPTAVCEFGETSTNLTVNGPVTLDNGAQRWTATVGLVQTQNFGELRVTWDFSIGGQDAQKVDYFDVVVPLIELDDLVEELGGDDLGGLATEAELIRAERKVRNFIESYTNQVFAPTVETIKVTSETGNFSLPKRLISVTSSVPNINAFEINGSGWIYTLKVPSLVEYTDQDFSSSTGVIRAPYYDVKSDAIWVTGRGKRTIEITGRWGYERVPAAVQEAALLLVEDFLAPESAYRDKYLISLTSPDWRIQFDRNAFRGTGNVRVDQLLEPYVNKNKWVVV